ncbi:hypothetical protein [Sphingobacterium sp. WOUb80]|uniref:hypothetical protein n=1 Tax=Sphingobacterium sp. WOUb80 TaxID=3234028 RepID=UPI003CEEED51
MDYTEMLNSLKEFNINPTIIMVIFIMCVVAAFFLRFLNSEGPLTGLLFKKKQKPRSYWLQRHADLRHLAKDIQKQQEFRELTGIYIHPDKIDKLIALRDNSNGEFDWPEIKAARSFMDLSTEQPKLRIDVRAKIFDIFTITLFSVGGICFALLFSIVVVIIATEKDVKPSLVASLPLCFVSIVFTFILMQSLRRNYRSAKLIKKVLGGGNKLSV